MTNLNMTNKLLLIASLLVLGGCAGIVKAPAHLDNQAKEFKSNPDYSQVFLYRNEILGAAISMAVTVDGQLAGTTGPNSYFKFDLPAGNHTFTSQGGKSVLTVETEVGELYFIWQEVKMGMFAAGSQLHLVSASQGKSGVLSCTLIGSPEITANVSAPETGSPAKQSSSERRIKCTPEVGCTYE